MCKFLNKKIYFLLLLCANLIKCSPIDLLLSEYYDDESDDVSGSSPQEFAKLGYDVHYDQRQNGSENYRVHIKDVLFGFPSSGATSALSAIAADYLLDLGGGGGGGGSSYDDNDDIFNDTKYNTDNELNQSLTETKLNLTNNDDNIDKPYAFELNQSTVVSEEPVIVLAVNNDETTNLKPEENQNINGDNLENDKSSPTTLNNHSDPAPAPPPQQRQTVPKLEHNRKNRFKSRIATILGQLLQRNN